MSGSEFEGAVRDNNAQGPAHNREHFAAESSSTCYHSHPPGERRELEDRIHKALRLVRGDDLGEPIDEDPSGRAVA